jgi:hypothetical protein
LDGRCSAEVWEGESKTEEPMKRDIWQENKERYFEWNPIESLGAKFMWAGIGAAVAVVAMYLLYLLR